MPQKNKACNMDGLVCYRDHPPQDTTYATKVFPLTPSIKDMQNNINTMTAHGGGDGPESVACALDEALKLDWRKNSVRICVVIADAPPHGIGSNGDGFPQGCPCGIDPLATARKMAENKIIIYSVACEPSLGNYANARAFFKSIAEITSGRYLSLGSAHLLPQVIIGGSAEEADLRKFEEEVIKETEAVKKTTPTLSTTELGERVTCNLAARGVRTWQLDITHQPDVIENATDFITSPTLADARTNLSSKKREVQNSMVAPSPAPVTSYQSQSAGYHHSPISSEQVSRVLKRNNHE